MGKRRKLCQWQLFRYLRVPSMLCWFFHIIPGSRSMRPISLSPTFSKIFKRIFIFFRTQFQINRVSGVCITLLRKCNKWSTIKTFETKSYCFREDANQAIDCVWHFTLSLNIFFPQHTLISSPYLLLAEPSKAMFDA